jgi:hypothetical protein
MMGCWLALSESDANDAPTIRLKVDHGGIKFPVSAKGKPVSAQGTFEKIAATDAEAKEAAAEHAQHHPGAKAPSVEKYQLKATGAIIR